MSAPKTVPETVLVGEDAVAVARRRSWMAPFAGLGRLLGGFGGMVGAVLLGTLVASALLAPWIAPFDWNETGVGMRLAAPDGTHWMGTDLYGRDLFSRIVYGGRYSLSIGVATVAISLVFGASFGAMMGFFGGRLDSIGGRVVDVLLGFPPLVLAILVVAVLGVGLWTAGLAVGIAGIPRFARVVRGATLSITAQPYIDGARAAGTSVPMILLRHVLPNLMPTLIVLSTLELGGAILATATLSFLGLGAQPPTPEWGAMLNAGREYVRYAPGTMIFPGLALFLTVMGVNLIGDRLAEILDPRLRSRH
ncbi:ABC transporter permease [Roseomonas sp. OT10]|uniref:ABC transporter permease n=1 Tax=Roseomonas cutis TaxID=2897332 RepID=UPI001E3CEDF9|nr:ABC transporter permease [Roseomonas sp. OT10]UFN48463.1 ABC transporter permease [Roseomonas sp. OT10]